MSSSITFLELIRFDDIITHTHSRAHESCECDRLKRHADEAPH